MPRQRGKDRRHRRKVAEEMRIARSCGGRPAMETEKLREIGRCEMVPSRSGMNFCKLMNSKCCETDCTARASDPKRLMI